MLEKERNWEVQRENETHVHGMRTSVICAHVRRARTNMALCCCEILSHPPSLTALQVSLDEVDQTAIPLRFPSILAEPLQLQCQCRAQS